MACGAAKGKEIPRVIVPVFVGFGVCVLVAAG